MARRDYVESAVSLRDVFGSERETLSWYLHGIFSQNPVGIFFGDIDETNVTGSETTTIS